MVDFFLNVVLAAYMLFRRYCCKDVCVIFSEIMSGLGAEDPFTVMMWAHSPLLL